MPNMYVKSVSQMVFATVAMLCLSHPLAAQQAPPIKVNLYLSVSNAEFYGQGVSTQIEAVGSTLFTELNGAFTAGTPPEISVGDDAFKQGILKLWETAPMYIPEESVILTVNELADGLLEVRGIPLMLRGDDGKEVYEEGVIFFSRTGEPDEFRISLPLHQYSKLLQEGTTQIDRERRQEIIAFTEALRTAYNKKDIDFIRGVFSDQALIIVGNVVKETDDSSPYSSNEKVQFLRFTKEEYLERLERVFRNNTFIEVEFEKISIMQHNLKNHVYGVNMDQRYKSSTYEDEGYLFLLVDFKKPEEPMIHVRVWQPMQETPESQVFQMGELEIF